MGEVSLRCREALRDATNPISAEDIARQAMRDKELDLADGKIRSDMIARLLWALHRLAKNGSVRKPRCYTIPEKCSERPANRLRRAAGALREGGGGIRRRLAVQRRKP
jgi:hypothetical protein